MKVAGLLAILFGGAMAYLIAYRCYSWADFLQEVANFVHLDLFSLKAGTPVKKPDCPSWIQ